MKFNLEWFKKHPAAAGAAILVGLLVVFVLFRKGGSSGSSFASIAANQQAGDLQLAELNAQQSAQSDQINAQVGLSEYQTEAQLQSSRDQLAASVVSGALPYQVSAQRQQQLLPLEAEALKISTEKNFSQLGEEELAALLGEGGTVTNRYGSTTILPASLPNTIGNGLFG